MALRGGSISGSQHTQAVWRSVAQAACIDDEGLPRPYKEGFDQKVIYMAIMSSRLIMHPSRGVDRLGHSDPVNGGDIYLIELSLPY